MTADELERQWERGDQWADAVQTFNDALDALRAAEAEVEAARRQNAIWEQEHLDEVNLRLEAQAEVQRLRERKEALEAWANERGHWMWCAEWQSGGACNCGLAALLNEAPR